MPRLVYLSSTLCHFTTSDAMDSASPTSSYENEVTVGITKVQKALAQALACKQQMQCSNPVKDSVDLASATATTPEIFDKIASAAEIEREQHEFMMDHLTEAYTQLINAAVICQNFLKDTRRAWDLRLQAFAITELPFAASLKDKSRSNMYDLLRLLTRANAKEFPEAEKYYQWMIDWYLRDNSPSNACTLRGRLAQWYEAWNRNAEAIVYFEHMVEYGKDVPLLAVPTWKAEILRLKTLQA